MYFIFKGIIEKFSNENNGEYRELADFALGELSLPHSNAECERVFSNVNNIKTKLRNRFITSTTNGLLLAKQCIKKLKNASDNCVNFTPNSCMLNSMTSTVLYPLNNSNDNSINDIIFIL